MRHSGIAALWFASAAGGATAVMAQEEGESLSAPVNIVHRPIAFTWRPIRSVTTLAAQMKRDTYACHAPLWIAATTR
jgi:hypothetical protein